VEPPLPVKERSFCHALNMLEHIPKGLNDRTHAVTQRPLPERLSARRTSQFFGVIRPIRGDVSRDG
jgi:hypothetical protein